jgi:hypothetical protein
VVRAPLKRCLRRSTGYNKSGPRGGQWEEVMVPILICIALISDAQHRPVMTVPLPGRWNEHECAIMGRSIIRNFGYPENYTYSSILVDSGLIGQASGLTGTGNPPYLGMGEPPEPTPGSRVWAPGALPKDSAQ